MPGSTCPNCGEDTFWKTPTGGKCSRCDYEMTVPANDGKSGKGKKCLNCKKYQVFDNKCRKCGTTYK